jgi:hypothetical protein
VIRRELAQQRGGAAETLSHLRLDGNGGFRGGRRRGRAQIRHQIADRHIDLVTDRGDRRDGTRGKCAGDALVVERPEILARAAAAPDDEHVSIAPSRDLIERDSTTIPGGVALHRRGHEHDLDDGQRRCVTAKMSRSAGPSRLVMTAMRRG